MVFTLLLIFLLLEGGKSARMNVALVEEFFTYCLPCFSFKEHVIGNYNGGFTINF